MPLSLQCFLTKTDEIFLDGNIFGANLQKSLSSYQVLSLATLAPLTTPNYPGCYLGKVQRCHKRYKQMRSDVVLSKSSTGEHLPVNNIASYLRLTAEPAVCYLLLINDFMRYSYFSPGI